MSVFTALYQLIIGPLELLFEVLFALASRVAPNPGLSIVFLSLAVNFLVLPLYKQADAMQEDARQTEANLAKWTAHIKKNFKGDERFMILQTYYRQNHYKPTDALKGSMSLLLEIPFFMAAYNFLSELQLLQGVSFGPIADLGAPDAMFAAAGITIHVLPVLMTVINLISGAIYTRGFPLKSKIQLYGMAVIFLVLLYDSPSGLVFYWTLNNLFSLVKNIFYKLKKPKLVLSILSAGVGIAGLVFFLFLRPTETIRTQALMIGAMLLLLLPLVLYLLADRLPKPREVRVTGFDRFCFFGGCIFLTVLTGLLIPSAVIYASPEEFINTVTYRNPLQFVVSSALLASGLFLVWFGIFYMLANPGGKKIMGLAMWLASGVAVVDYMFFGTDFGSINASLKYDFYPNFLMKNQLTNLAVLVILAGVLFLLWKNRQELLRAVSVTLILAISGMSVFNIAGIQAAVPETLEALRTSASDMASIPLSKSGKNVVIFMMDRAISAYIPYIMNEKPEIKDQFAGFTYYPNTISYGAHTNFGSPGFFGGYEYTPEEMNKRDTELLVDKQNEALTVMPRIFLEEGYDVTVCDPAYANYRWIPDLSIYDDYPEISAYNTMGKYDAYSKEVALLNEQMSNRNFFCFSIFKTAPMLIQPTLYAQGLYNHPDAIHKITVSEQITDGCSKAVGIRGHFAQSFAVLENLPSIAQITDSEENTFTMMCNDTTHEPCLLQEPEYVPQQVVDNTEFDEANMDRFTVDGKTLHMEHDGQFMGYEINMAAMIQLGKFMDYLRENDVYDNTRIIIGADHGYYMNNYPEMRFGKWDIMAYNPLLMVKDFGSTEFTTDYSFMTNADVPTLSTDGLVENPVNPFTGKPINSDPKQGEQHVFLSTQYNTSINDGTTFIPDEWLSVHDNIFDLNNWKELGFRP